MAGIAAAVLSGVHYSKTAVSTYQAGDNKIKLVGAAALKPYLELPDGKYLIGGLTSDQTVYLDHLAIPWFRLNDDTYIKYPIPGRGGDSHGQTPGLTCGGASSPPPTASSRTSCRPAISPAMRCARARCWSRPRRGRAAFRRG